MKLETRIAQIDQAIANGENPPEGAAFGDGQIETIQTDRGVIRRHYRDYAILEEKNGGVYTIPDASGISRFP